MTARVPALEVLLKDNPKGAAPIGSTHCYTVGGKSRCSSNIPVSESEKITHTQVLIDLCTENQAILYLGPGERSTQQSFIL